MNIAFKLLSGASTPYKGEAGWKPLLLQMFAIPVFWIVMVVSASVKKREMNV